MSKLISTFKIGFGDETKAEIAALKSSLDAIKVTLGVSSALLGSAKPNGGLLAAMVGEAANDAPVFAPEFLELGQWVFEGQDEKWQSAAVNSDGRAYLHNMPKRNMYFNHSSYGWSAKRFDRHEMKRIEGFFDPSGFATGFIERETVNDVDYLSETVPEIQGMDACDIIIDEMGRDYSHNSNCLHAVVPQITQADMQLIFIKNLSDVLIQRMHSMDRFSDDGRSVFCNEFKAWDIVVNKANDNPHYAVVCGFGAINLEGVAQKISLIKVTPWDSRDGHCQGGDWMIFGQKSSWRTITEAELPAFRAALEACYV